MHRKPIILERLGTWIRSRVNAHIHIEGKPGERVHPPELARTPVRDGKGNVMQCLNTSKPLLGIRMWYKSQNSLLPTLQDNVCRKGI